MSKLYLPIGIFGSGKSTWARSQDPNIQIVSGDNIRWMLNGGEYIYNESIEPVIIDILFDAAKRLLDKGYDVILDECYCSLNIEMRKLVALRFHKTDLVPVIFPVKDVIHHVQDKVKKDLRGKTPDYWTRVYTEMINVYEPFNPTKEYYFGKPIHV